MSIRGRLQEAFYGHVGVPGHRGGSAPAGGRLDRKALQRLERRGKKAYAMSASAKTLPDVNKSEKATRDYRKRLRSFERKGWKFRMPTKDMNHGHWKYAGTKGAVSLLTKEMG